jgi:hypothetical protein
MASHGVTALRRLDLHHETREKMASHGVTALRRLDLRHETREKNDVTLVTALRCLDLRHATASDPDALAHSGERSPSRWAHLIHALSPGTTGTRD